MVKPIYAAKKDMLSHAITELTETYLFICEQIPQYEPGMDLRYELGKFEGYRQCIHELICMYDCIIDEEKTNE